MHALLLSWLRQFLFRVLPVTMILVPLFFHPVAAAPTRAKCDMYACPEVGGNGYALVESPYAISPEGPYSIFDCVYV